MIIENRVWIISGMIGLEIGILTVCQLLFLMQCDPQHGLHLNGRIRLTIVCYSAVVGGWIGTVLGHWGRIGQMACGILAAYLLVASITDRQTYQVYDVTHIPAAVAGGLLLCRNVGTERFISLIIYIIIQSILFMHMYGRADGYAFIVCALFESRYGCGLLTYLLHMFLSFGILAIIQAFRHNINSCGNLKRPVPFLPYIAGTVWFFL